MTSVFIGQIIGYAASAASLTVFFRKKRKDMIALKLLSDILWMTHHVLIGSFPAAATTLIAVGRESVFYVTAKNGKMNNVYPVVFSFLFALSAVFTWKDAYSFLPAMCSIAATAAFWNKNTQAIRSPLTGVTSDSWDTPAGHRVYDACRGSSVFRGCRLSMS